MFFRVGVSRLFSESWKSRISIDFPENPENLVKAIEVSDLQPDFVV